MLWGTRLEFNFRNNESRATGMSILMSTLQHLVTIQKKGLTFSTTYEPIVDEGDV